MAPPALRLPSIPTALLILLACCLCRRLPTFSYVRFIVQHTVRFCELTVRRSFFLLDKVFFIEIGPYQMPQALARLQGLILYFKIQS